MLLFFILAMAADSAQAHYQRGVDYFRQRQFEAARSALSRAVQIDPSLARAWKALGAVHAAQQQYTLAEAPLRKACELDPREEDACYYVARNYYYMNRFEAAVTAYERALAVDRLPWRIHNGLALSLEGLRRSADAERNFRAAVKAYDGRGRPDENPRIDMGAFLYREGRISEALPELERAVRDSPDAPRARLELARGLFSRDRLAEAAVQLERAVALQADNWPAHLLLGKVYYRLGRATDAERHTRLGQQGVER